MIKIRAATADDVQALKGRLREADALEVIAEGNGSVEEALAVSFARSRLCFSVEQDGDVLAMWGIVPDSTLGPSARVWFLGAEGMNKIKKSFLQQSRAFVNVFLSHYPLLWNTVDLRYKAAIRWLAWLGAEFSSQDIRGPHGDQFLLFRIRRA